MANHFEFNITKECNLCNCSEDSGSSGGGDTEARITIQEDTGYSCEGSLVNLHINISNASAEAAVLLKVDDVEPIEIGIAGNGNHNFEFMSSLVNGEHLLRVYFGTATGPSDDFGITVSC